MTTMASEIGAPCLPETGRAPIGRIRRFLDQESPPTPCLVVDLDVVEERYLGLRAALPEAAVHYAVKANPHPAVLRRLVGLGSSFDVASPAEIDLCLDAGAHPHTISYGNTVKKRVDIAYAYRQGVRLFVFDSDGELEKLAAAAPGASVVCRILVSSKGADWPLSRKFGCEPEMAIDLLLQAREAGLDPCGVSFHVGSQQRRPEVWDVACAQVATIFADLADVGLGLRLVNLGGGFPARYTADVPSIDAYGDSIGAALDRHLGRYHPAVVVEPGRYVVGDAGVLRAEVVLVSQKSYADERRWVYLDVGRFGGLAETEGEAITYPISTYRDGGPVGPVVLAGPTCDSVDVLYERTRYLLPLDLQVGDHVDILSTGAYTSAYASVGFNGFPPLSTYCI